MFNKRTIFGEIIKILDDTQVVVAVDGCNYKELVSIDINELAPYYQCEKQQLIDCKIYCTGRENDSAVDGYWLVDISSCEVLVNVLDAESVLY